MNKINDNLHNVLQKYTIPQEKKKLSVIIQGTTVLLTRVTKIFGHFDTLDLRNSGLGYFELFKFVK